MPHVPAGAHRPLHLPDLRRPHAGRPRPGSDVGRHGCRFRADADGHGGIFRGAARELRAKKGV